MVKVYKASYKKTLIISGIILIIIITLFSLDKGRFNVNGFYMGLLFGGIFVSFPIIYGLGQAAWFTETEFLYSSNLISYYIDRFRDRISKSDISEVRIGLPKINTDKNTFASINVSSVDKEISFNPDLFDNTTLRNIFLEFKNGNEHIIFDEISSSILQSPINAKNIRKSVFKKFLNK